MRRRGLVEPDPSVPRGTEPAPVKSRRSATPPKGAAYLTEGTATGRAHAVGIDLVTIAAAHRTTGLDWPREAAEARAMRRGIRRELGTAQREAALLLTPELRSAAGLRPRG